VQALFELDFQDRPADAVIAERLAGSRLSDVNQAFARGLVQGVLHDREDIDAQIAEAAPNGHWTRLRTWTKTS